MPITIMRTAKHKTIRPQPDLPVTEKLQGPKGISAYHIPREPDYTKEDDKILYAEQQTSRVETLMLKGYRDRLKIADMLNLSAREVDDYIRRVFARWEIEGGQKHFTTYRGEMVLKLRQVEIEMWETYEEAKKDAAERGKPLQLERVMMALNNIKGVSLARAEMLGLTKETVERMMETETEQNLDFKRKSETFEQGARVAARLLDIVEERLALAQRSKRAATIEHEATDAR